MTNSLSEAQMQWSRSGTVCAICGDKRHDFVTAVVKTEPVEFEHWCHSCYDKNKERDNVKFI